MQLRPAAAQYHVRLDHFLLTLNSTVASVSCHLVQCVFMHAHVWNVLERVVRVGVNTPLLLSTPHV